MVQEFLIALGSNLGMNRSNPLETVQNSIRELSNRRFTLRRVSRFFVTPCFPAGAGPDYVNACVAISHHGNCDDVLKNLHEIEADFGRERQQRWGSRTLDLDLIASGAQVLPSDAIHTQWRDLPLEQQKMRAPQELIVPHPRIQERAFVLVPLCDVAPNWVHPILGRTVREMTEALPSAQRNEVIPI
ncbi:MAG: 2-amino-4-hydroxy-6-hydroxymethyldihydropteridine diphosphokinase [Pelagimonas sp.]|uniref:2-amino-4-hydroxy-6- hydroxymethyldihydropteridine diphosphokinase n=1 Tax=Pelagimonas sp. TaxID=2073170 RepID=UPI003D6C1199